MFVSLYAIGHSLGAHTCGFMGKNSDLESIIGLDPAGPILGDNSPAARLSRSDANYVQIIHTNIDVFGYVRLSNVPRLDK